jgi:hypothetical protein
MVGAKASEWHAAQEACLHCGDAAFSPEYGPDQLIMCEACTFGACHIKCHKERTGIWLEEEVVKKAGAEWFCSQVRVWRPPGGPPRRFAALPVEGAQRAVNTHLTPRLLGPAPACTHAHRSARR